jgi:hypothetical protein
MRAETGLGATGWAWGSQTCIGIRPALVPKPIRPRMNRPTASVGEALARAGANVVKSVTRAAPALVPVARATMTYR